MKTEVETDRQNDIVVDLEACLVQVEASKAWFTRRVLPLSIEQLRWRPSPQHWSIGECLDHLNLTLGWSLPKIDDAIVSAGRQAKTFANSHRYALHEIEALDLVEPPVTIPVQAHAALVPSAAVDLDWLVDRFHQTRNRYADAVRRAFGLDLARILIVEPVYPSIYSLGGAIAFIAAHDRRHMWQAERVKTTSRFPRAVFTALARTSGQLNL